jgi:DNA topoisomerase III
VQRVYRAKFSSIAAKDLQQAFADLKAEPSFNESVSVDARQVLDLKIGVAFSRFQTKALQKTLGVGRGAKIPITYGPCQTPTLGFCVDQAEKIKKFIPEPFWKIELTIQEKDKKINLKWFRGKIYD